MKGWWGENDVEAGARSPLSPQGAAQRCFLGIDGGGSKTACLVAQGTGQVLGAGLGGPINLNFVSEKMARESIAQAVGGAWRVAGPPISVPAVAAISGPIPLIIAQEVIARETGAERVIHIGGREAAWEATFPWLDFDCGVAVDVGTGSLAFVYITWSLLAEVLSNLTERGMKPHVYKSVNLPGAREFNEQARAAYERTGI